MRIRTWMAFLSLCLVAAVLLSGCLGERTSPSPRTDPPGIMVDYQRTGGIAGVNDRLVIFDNGVAMISTRKIMTEFSLNQTELELIDSLFKANRFMELEGNYTSAREGADFLQYSISYCGKTVKTEDTAIPDQAQPIIDEMNRIAAMATANEMTGSPLPRISP
ncbi:MAG: hypothetical protein M0Q92_04120 [Methanoregula sp.]|nr:hypothetical protein [Methanoregula sp.]